MSDSNEVSNIEIHGHGVLFVLRDRDMEQFTEEKGGKPMPDGEGTLAIWFRPLDPPAQGYRSDVVTPDHGAK
jgi:hypothetical protein